MEGERSEKLEELNNTIENLTEDKARIEKARKVVAEILSEVGNTKDKVKLWQEDYQDHVNFLRALDRDSPGARIKSLRTHVKYLQQILNSFARKVSILSKELRGARNDIIPIIKDLTEKRDLIKNAKSPEELELIRIVAPPLRSQNLFLAANDMDSKWTGMGLSKKVKEATEELRTLVDEERAQLTGT